VESGERAKVLLADDVAFFRRYLGEVLRAAGLEVLEAATGTDVLARLEQREDLPNLLLVDIDLPEEGAVGLLPVVRSRYTREELAIVLLTQVSESEELRKLRDLGADGHVDKQAPAEHILFSVRQAIARGARDRRGSPRILVDSPILYEGETHRGIGRLVDIGAGGLHVQSTESPPPAGTVLRLSFVFPGREEEVVAEGRVVRSAPLRFSVAFKALDETARAAIVSFLEGAAG
jgi:CheY-like chemotaxis protein